MPYKDPKKKREADREWYRKQKEKNSSTRSVPAHDLSEISETDIQYVLTIKGLCNMLGKHLLIVDKMQMDAVIKAKTISTLANTMGKIIVTSDLESELAQLKSELAKVIELQKLNDERKYDY